MAKRAKTLEERQNKMTVAVGKPGCGKTTELLRIYDVLAKSRAVILYDLSNEPKYRNFPVITSKTIRAQGAAIQPGIYRFSSADDKRSIEFFREYLRNAVLVFEDASSYVPANLPDYLITLISIRRQLGLDLFFVFHALRMVPPRILTMCNYILIKKTGDSISKLKNLDSLPHPALVIAAWKKVQADPNPYAFVNVPVN